MRVNGCRWRDMKICVAASSLFLFSTIVYGQDASSSRAAASSSPASEREGEPEIRALADLIRDLQAQVKTLNSQLSELRTEEQRTSEEARELRHELDLAKGRMLPTSNATLDSTPASVSQGYPSGRTPSPGAPPSTQNQAGPESSSRSDEDQQLIEGKLNDLYQTKVESGSKYRIRLSGLVLLNIFDNHGTVDNLDYPQVATPPQTPPLFIVPSTLGGTLRQSQIRLQAFGPDIAGARTSADVEFDFAGGFPGTPNGAAMGVVRLRTGTIRVDWANTSIVAGQDRLFFAPLAPTSLATLAVPALSYAGNLWAWTPQVRIEHRFVLSDTSSVSVQGGILDSLSGDYPVDTFTRFPTWGEMSGQPAYASRISLSRILP
jgi:hypothetical protein